MSGRLGRLPGSGKLRCEKRGRDSKPVYVLDYRMADGTRQRVALGNDKRMAETRQRQLLHERDLASMGLGGSLGQDRQLRELKSMYLADLTVRACERHVINVASTLDRVLDALHAKLVRELVPYDLMQHRAAQLSAGLATRTVNIQVSCLKAMLTWALKAGLIEKHPLAHLSPLRENEATKRYRRRALTEDEIESFLQAAYEDDARNAQFKFTGAASTTRVPHLARRAPRARIPQEPFWRFLLESGARYGEAVKAAWSDVDLDRRLFLLRAEHTKAHRQRTIPLLDLVVAELRELREQQMVVLRRPLRPDDRVFLSATGCAWPTPTTNAMRIFDRLLETAGIDRVDPQGKKLDVHSLRHTAATRFARAGVPLIKTQKLLGHSDPKLTAAIYSHVDAEDLRDAVDAIGRKHSATGSASKAG